MKLIYDNGDKDMVTPHYVFAIRFVCVHSIECVTIKYIVHGRGKSYLFNKCSSPLFAKIKTVVPWYIINSINS